MDFKELHEQLTEGRDAANPASMLVLKRRGIRVFPDGQRVALYTNEKYNLTFMVPFGTGIDHNTPINAVPTTNEAFVNVMSKLASVVANIPKNLASRKQAELKAADDKTKADREKASKKHVNMRQKQLKRAMQNRRKRQVAAIIASRSGNQP
jgi:hypothetical protein